tara:strand:+ start:1829 stop:3100 length:1272 start_codon:yes stop_codon:yes gene_type:complete
MLKKPVLFSYFLFMFCLCSFSDNQRIIDTLEIHKQIKSFGIDEDVLDFKSHFFSDLIFKNDSTIIYNPNGSLHLFEINLGDIPQVSKISKSLNGGYDNRYLFLHSDTIYSLGGEGLFNSFPGLIYFDDFSGNWKKKAIKFYPIDSEKILNSWKIGDKVMVLLSPFQENDNGYFSEALEFSFGEIDLRTFEYVQHNNFKSTFQELLFQSGLGFFRGNYVYDSDLYSLHGYYQSDGDVEYRILDKAAGSLNRNSKLDAIKSVDGLSYLYVEDTTIYHRDRYGDIKSFGVNEGQTVHKKEFFKLYTSKVNNGSPSKISIFYYLVIIIPICTLIFFLLKKRKNSLLNNIPYYLDENLVDIINKLKNEKSNTFTKNRLDEIFNISHYSYETIKTRRSDIIKKINKFSNIKIDRVRKVDDKRFYEYKIT